MAPRAWGWSEKKTDVWIAAEMVSLACNDAYDIAILVTADSDLTPAAEFVKMAGKGVELVTFPDSTPAITHLRQEVNSTTRSRKSWFKAYE